MRDGYKKTEIGVIPLDWEVVKFNILCDFISVGIATSTSKHCRDTGVPLIRNQNILENKFNLDDLLYIDNAFDEENKNKRIKEKDILIVRTGYPGISAVVKKEMIGWQTFTTLIARPKHNIIFSEYLSYFINSNIGKKMIKGLQAGGAQKNLNVVSLNKLLIIVPPLPQQKKIAKILSTTDNKIEAITKQIEKAEIVKKGLMQRLLSEGLGHSEFKESELGMIPKMWEVVELRDVGKVSMCKRIMKDETTDDGEIPFYKIGTFGKKANAYISQEIYEDYKKKYSFPKKGDILISASGTIGRLVVYNGKPAYFQDSNIVWIDNQENKLLNSLLFYIYKTVKWHTDGNTIARLYNENLRRIKIPLPSIMEQKKIANILTKADQKIEILKAKKEQYQILKTGLMQKLLTGEIGV